MVNCISVRLCIVATLVLGPITSTELPTARGDDFPADYQAAVPQALVSITCGNGSGTAFVIGADAEGGLLLITCHHVITPHSHKGFSCAFDFYPHGTIDAVETSEILACSLSHDLALLRVVTNATPAALPVASPAETPTDATFPALTAGFPGGQLNCLSTWVIEAKPVACTDGNVIRSWCLRDVAGPGASGSPLIAMTANGYRVVGVYWGSNEQSASASVHLPLFVEKYAPIYQQPDIRAVIRSNTNAFTRDFHALNMQLKHLVR